MLGKGTPLGFGFALHAHMKQLALLARSAVPAQSPLHGLLAHSALHAHSILRVLQPNNALHAHRALHARGSLQALLARSLLSGFRVRVDVTVMVGL